MNCYRAFEEVPFFKGFLLHALAHTFSPWQIRSHPDTTFMENLVTLLLQGTFLGETLRCGEGSEMRRGGGFRGAIEIPSRFLPPPPVFSPNWRWLGFGTYLLTTFLCLDYFHY